MALSADKRQTVITVDIDRYGSDARASALADYLEVAALSGIRVTRAGLVDIIRDNEWVSRPVRRYLTPENVDEDPEAWGDAVFSVIAEREAVLADRYPFKESGGGIVLKDPLMDKSQSGYLSLLAVTIVHAWNLKTTEAPEAALEQIVADTLAAMGLTAVNVGATDRQSGFVSALHDAANRLGLRAMADPRPRSASAKDVGVDTLAGLPWRDERQAGQWLIIGQVTTAQSQRWGGKLAEPQPPRWADYLQEKLHPMVFLAIPHHAEREHLTDLMESRRGSIVDRLRLVAKKPPNSGVERALIDAMLAATVEE